MPSSSPQTNSILSKLIGAGRAVGHLLYPNDVEAYYLVLELVDADLNPIRSFLWPIMPAEIIDTQKEVTTATMNYGGVHVIKTDTFTPRKITIQGMFGRRVYLVNTTFRTRTDIPDVGVDISCEEGGFSLPGAGSGVVGKREFNQNLKTGYGALKVLEFMKECSKRRDKTLRQRYLFLYNPVLGSNYVVEFDSFERMQNADTSNVLYPYRIQMTAVADLDTVLSNNRLRKVNALALLGGIANNVLRSPLRNGSPLRSALRNPLSLLA